MTLDIRIAAVSNLAFQLLLMIILFVAAYLARRKQFGKHCMVMRLAVPLQLIAIVVAMLPSMLGYIKYPQPGSLLKFEILAHHTLGVAVIVLWIYINFVSTGVLRLWGRLSPRLYFRYRSQ